MALLAGIGALVAACGSTSPATNPTPVGCTPQGAAASADSASYHYVLDVGPTEQMYTRAQVAATHPKTGEVMLSGSMSSVGGSMAGMAGMGTASADAQHLEIHICSRTTGEVVTGPAPTIKLTDSTAGTTTNVEVATMQGVTSGQADLHYGNNVIATPGHAFVVNVDFHGQQATLHFTRPA